MNTFKYKEKKNANWNQFVTLSITLRTLTPFQPCSVYRLNWKKGNVFYNCGILWEGRPVFLRTSMSLRKKTSRASCVLGRQSDESRARTERSGGGERFRGLRWAEPSHSLRRRGEPFWQTSRQAAKRRALGVCAVLGVGGEIAAATGTFSFLRFTGLFLLHIRNYLRPLPSFV